MGRGTSRIMGAFIAAAAVAFSVFWLYYPSTTHDFLAVDDGAMVFDDPHVSSGLSWENVKAAFSVKDSFHFWLPATKISLMVDAQIHGLDPGGFHLTNNLLFALSGALFCILVWRLTGSIPVSVITAVLFAFHPMRVESVAWITERKDVLSFLFVLLGLLSYERYVRTSSLVAYALTIVCMFLGLLSKPMVVIFPLLLLALDGWPFQRQGGADAPPWRAWLSLAKEKIPFFALSAATILFSIIRQEEIIPPYPWATRLAFSATAHVQYLVHTFLPTGLVFPHNEIQFPLVTTIGALTGGALVLGASLGAWLLRRKLPSLAFGWFWFLAALLPGNGLVPSGNVLWADRFTLFAHMGLAIGLVGTWHAANRTRPWIRRSGWILFAVLALLLAAQTRRYLAVWKDTETLFTYVEARLGASSFAEENLGADHQMKGDIEGARVHYDNAVRIVMDNANAHYNRGVVAFTNGDYRSAAADFRTALSISPSDRQSRFNLAATLAELGELDEAESVLSTLPPDPAEDWRTAQLRERIQEKRKTWSEGGISR